VQIAQRKMYKHLVQEKELTWKMFFHSCSAAEQYPNLKRGFLWRL